ncbi:MAG: hypothetical protein V4474_02850 [Patescibacteria group bacterium]
MKTALVIYEARQIRVATEKIASLSVEERSQYTIIALGADIEFRLEEQNISFVSGRNFRKTLPVERLSYAQHISWALCTDPALTFFAHRGVSLGRVYAAAVQEYVSIFLYYIDIFNEIARSSYDFRHLVVPSTQAIFTSASGVLAELELHASVDAAKLVCTQHRISIDVLPPNKTSDFSRGRARNVSFKLKRALFGLALGIWNSVIKICLPPKKIRLLVTDYWRNIEPYLDEMPEAEVMLMDRSEIFQAGLRQSWMHRMRFIHSADFSSRGASNVAAKSGKELYAEWTRVKSDVGTLDQASFCGYPLRKPFEVVIDRLISSAADAVFDIENTYTMLHDLKPDIVMVRASVSAQRHFSLTCYVAQALGIPSLEVQHGLLYLGPGSYANHPAAEYVADYGPLSREGLKNVGYTDKQLFDVGSPRFDVYARSATYVAAAPDVSAGTVYIMPAITVGLWVDTYDFIDFCESIAAASVPQEVVTLKLRPGPEHGLFYKEVFERVLGTVAYRIARREPLPELLAKARFIVSCYSTALLESLLMDKPVVYAGLTTMHRTLGLEIENYAEKGALLMAHSTEELKQQLTKLRQSPELQKEFKKGAQMFMASNYTFRGDASRRLADTIRTITKK